MINIKKQDPVADAVRDILQQEALKGNQHKIDKNKNNKIDAHDFKILRGENPEVKKEEVEQIDELKKSTVKSYIAKKMASLPGKKPKKDQEDLMKAHHRVTGVKPTSEEVESVEKGNNPFDYKNYKSQLPTKPGEKAGFDSKKISTGTVYNRKPVKDEPMKKEEVEQIDELSKSTLGSYVKNAARDVGASRSLGADFKNKAEKSRKPNIKAASSRLSDRFNAVAQKRHAGIGKAVERLTKEEIEQVDERTLSTRETAEKERIVKGMKKNLAGFKARYGERAKSVMYATATKNAMKEEALEEGKRPEGDTVPFVQNANTSSSPMKKIKEVAGAAMKKISKDLKTK